MWTNCFFGVCFCFLHINVPPVHRHPPSPPTPKNTEEDRKVNYSIRSNISCVFGLGTGSTVVKVVFVICALFVVFSFFENMFLETTYGLNIIQTVVSRIFQPILNIFGIKIPGFPRAGIPLTIDTRWTICPAWIIVEPNGTIWYQVTPQKLMAYGGSPGVAGYSWGKPTGGRSPPSGITIDPQTGVLRGTGGALPKSGTYYFDVEVSDGTSTASVTFSIEVKKYVKKAGPIPDPGPPYAEFQQPLMQTIQLPDGKAGQPYGATLYVMGGKPFYSWRLDSTYKSNFTLAGLTLDASGGLVRGTISSEMAGQTIRFKVIVRDNTGEVAIGEPVYEIYVKP